MLREWTEYSLGEMMGSSRILSLMQTDITAKGEILANDLYTLEPFYLRLLCCLLNKSNAAYTLSMLGKFLKSSTIIALSQAISLKSITEASKALLSHIITSILASMHIGRNILDFLHGCTVDSVDKLRELTQGRKLHGVTMPFIAEQVKLCNSVIAQSVRRSIIFRPLSLLEPRCWVKKGNRSLYINSRTFVKINQEAITGLPEGKIGKMAEDLTAACDWIKLRGSVGPNLKQLSSRLLEEKGVIPPDVPSVG